MACWSDVQKKRLAYERGILDQYFPGKIKWINHTNAKETRVEWEATSNSDKKYRLRLYLPEDYPNSCPHMAIIEPEELQTRGGKSLPILDDKFHTLGLTVDGFTKLCHFTPELWTGDNTLYLVLMKGRLWIEGYEGHLQTGNLIDHYLAHQVPQPGNQDDGQKVEAAIESNLKKEPEKSSCCIS